MRRAKAFGAIGWFVFLTGAALIGAREAWADYGLALWLGGLVVMGVAISDLIRASRAQSPKYLTQWRDEFPA